MKATFKRLWFQTFEGGKIKIEFDLCLKYQGGEETYCIVQFSFMNADDETCFPSSI